MGFVEDSELAKDGGAVVIDFFSGEAVFGVEGVNAAEWEFDAVSGGRKTAPGALVRAADDDLEQNGVVGDMLTLHFYFQIRQGGHELGVKEADSVGACVVFAPRLVVVTSSVAESAENPGEVVGVFEPNVLLD